MRWIQSYLILVFANLTVPAGAVSLPEEGFAVQAWRSGASIPDSPLRDLQGRTWRLSELRGRAVLLNFWASWCEPCRAEMPSLQALQQAHPQSLVVLAVNYREPTPAVELFVQRQGWTLPIVTDPDGGLARRWGIGIFPSSVLIDARGRVQAVVRGEVDWLAQRQAPWMQRWLGAVR